MRWKVVFLALFLILVSSVSARNNFDSGDLRINHIGLGDFGIIYPWEDEILVRVSLSNLGDDDLDNVQVKVLIDEFDVIARSSQFDIEQNNRHNENRRTAVIIVRIPFFAKKGDYLARIIVENEKVSKVRHRYVTLLR